MISRLAIFGATGDLTARYLLPGLAALQTAGHLGDGFVLVVEWGSTSTEEVVKAVAASSIVSERLLGAVLNKADETIMRRFEGYTDRRYNYYTDERVPTEMA